MIFLIRKKWQVHPISFSIKSLCDGAIQNYGVTSYFLQVIVDSGQHVKLLRGQSWHDKTVPGCGKGIMHYSLEFTGRVKDKKKRAFWRTKLRRLCEHPFMKEYGIDMTQKTSLLTWDVRRSHGFESALETWKRPFHQRHGPMKESLRNKKDNLLILQEGG
mgnify:CR=1 FL=1